MSPQPPAVPDYFWRSLRFFCFYRLAVVVLFMVASLIYGDVLNVGSLDPTLFRRAVMTYGLAAVVFVVMIVPRKVPFGTQLFAQVMADIAFITIMMYASGGQRSGLAVLLLMVLAGAGLVGQGRMSLFFAAVASMAMLFEQALQTLRRDADPADFFRTGLICVGFFGMAVTARLLARRVVANEELAQQRGRELASQLAISNRIISDMSEGVLVLDRRGFVRQSNANADRLLLVRRDASNLSDWAPQLARRLFADTVSPDEATEIIRAPSGFVVRLRLLASSIATPNPVAYVEDMERVQLQAQQMKLAALGRLTTNIAHEVRNPLSAISHAAELLSEDEVDSQRRRLAAIIGDNAGRLNQLVTEVLELGRRDRAHPESLQWHVFMQAFVDELHLKDPSAVTRTVWAGDDVTLWFDRNHLFRVLWNLMTNALRHASDDPGAIQIHMSKLPDARACLDIVDDGPGIDAALRAQIFEPFVTSHGAGTGLGLYIARELCEANGAHLELIEEGAAQGGHFRVTMERPS